MRKEELTLSFEELGYVIFPTGYVKRRFCTKKLFLSALALIFASSVLGYYCCEIWNQAKIDSRRKLEEDIRSSDKTRRAHDALKRLKMYAVDGDGRSWKADDLAYERSATLCREAETELQTAENRAIKRELNTLLLRGTLSLARQELYRGHTQAATQLLTKARSLASDDLEYSLKKQFYLTAGAIEPNIEKLKNDLAKLLALVNEAEESPDVMCNINAIVGLKYLELNKLDKAQSCLDKAAKIAESTESPELIANALKSKIEFMVKKKANAREIKRLKKKCANLEKTAVL